MAGTNYTGPHRVTHKVAAVAVTSGVEEQAAPDKGQEKRKNKRERQRDEEEHVAATSNMATSS